MNAFTPGARRAAEAREAAHRLGRRTYRGQPCRRGHSGERYVSTWHCVECHAERANYGEALHRNTLLATLYPQEFDAMGWHRLAVEEPV